MPRKKKNALPSGSVRVQRRYKDGIGKVHTKSFTAPTKSEAEAMAAEWAEKRGRISTRITVSEAVKRYIDMKEGVLSPSTARTYRGTLSTRIEGTALGKTDLFTVSSTDVQIWISDLAKEVKPKTVRNAAALISSTLLMFLPDLRIHVTLPQKIKPDHYCPSEEEVGAVVAQTSDPQMKAAILLAAIGTMRRGEICGLYWSDIDGCTIHVRHSVVLADGGWIVKEPKTPESRRDIRMPQEVIDTLNEIPKTGELIFSYQPDQISDRFRRVVRDAGVHRFRFHDLRHFAASQMHLKGIPDKYIEARGGWRPGSTVMKNVYQDVIDLERRRMDKEILGVFSDLVVQLSCN